MELKTCCFTGHRPSGFSFGYNEKSDECIRIKNELRREIVKMIENHGVGHFITGMALGVDTWAAEAVLDLKNIYPDIKLTAAIPFPGQSNRWGTESRQRYISILKRCDGINVISRQWTSYCMSKRNHYMVDSSEYVIGVWNGKFSGGTGKTVEYALKQAKNIVIINSR